MKRLLYVFACVAVVLVAGPPTAWPQGTSPPPNLLTYQARVVGLSAGAEQPLNGQFDARFLLFSTSDGGTALLTDEHVGTGAVNIRDSLLTVLLGSGVVTGTETMDTLFRNNSEVFLETQLKNPATGTFESLLPRVRIVSSAYSLSSLSAADSLKLNGQPGSFYLDASNVSAGALSDARLSANVALLDAAQTFTAAKSFNALVAAPGGITGLPAPAGASDAATKGYVDLVTGGGASGWTDDGTAVRLTTASDLVGIGTAAPAKRLDVFVNDALSTDGVRITNAAPSFAGERTVVLDLRNLDATSNRTYRFQNVGNAGVPARNGDLEVFDLTAGARRLTIGASGDVGIGDVQPSQKLHVFGSGTASNALVGNGAEASLDVNATAFAGTTSVAASHVSTNRFFDGTTWTRRNAAFDGWIWLQRVEDDADGGYMEFINVPKGGAEPGTDNGVLRILADGRVGVGLTSPDQKLTVAGTIHSTSGGFMFPDGTVQATAGGGSVGGGWTDDGAVVRLTASGDFVGIGTANPAAKLDVAGDVKLSAGGTITGPTNGELNINSDASVNSFLDLNNGVARPVRLFVDADGGVKAGLEVYDYATASNDLLRISHNGTDALIENTDAAGHIFLLPGATGGVGIGLAAGPGLRLAVDGTVCAAVENTTVEPLFKAAQSGTGDVGFRFVRNTAPPPFSPHFVSYIMGVGHGGTAFQICFDGQTDIAQLSDASAVLTLAGTNVGIGTTVPGARLGVDSGVADASGLRFTKLTSASPAGAAGTKVLSVNASGDVVLVTDATGGGGGITNLNGLTAASQTFSNDTNVTISSAGSTHTLGWSGTLAVGRGGTGAGTLTGLLRGNGTGAITGGAVASLTSEVTGTLPVGNGGTGATTLTGPLRGTGTAAVAADSYTANKVLVGNGTSAFITNTNFHWDNTNARLGIRNSAPTGVLDVTSNDGVLGLRVQGSAANAMFRVQNTNAGGDNLDIEPGTDGVQFQINDANVMKLSDGGKVGIGLTNPSRQLVVHGGAGVSFIMVQNNTTGAGTGDGLELSHTGNECYVWNYEAGNLELAGGNGGGTTRVNGALTVTGSKNFLIDHPLDPDNKVLRHACVEGPERMNVYKGHAKLKDGAATIELPSYFDALNHPEGRNVSITCIGGWSPLYVEGPLRGNAFTVRGGPGASPNQEFDWVVLGVRNDAYARANPLVVEEEKDTAAPVAVGKGEYLNPAAYGKPPRRGPRPSADASVVK